MTTGTRTTLTRHIPSVLEAVTELGLDLDRYWVHTDGSHIELHCHACTAWGNGLVLDLDLDDTLEPLTIAANGHECTTDAHRLVWTHSMRAWSAECLCGWKAARTHTTYTAGKTAYVAHPRTKGRRR